MQNNTYASTQIDINTLSYAHLRTREACAQALHVVAQPQSHDRRNCVPNCLWCRCHKHELTQQHTQPAVTSSRSMASASECSVAWTCCHPTCRTPLPRLSTCPARTRGTRPGTPAPHLSHSSHAQAYVAARHNYAPPCSPPGQTSWQRALHSPPSSLLRHPAQIISCLLHVCFSFLLLLFILLTRCPMVC